MTKTVAGIIIFFLTIGWILFLAFARPEVYIEPIWGDDDSATLYLLVDPYQNKIRIIQGQIQELQAQEYFLGKIIRNPFEQLVHERNFI